MLLKKDYEGGLLAALIPQRAAGILKEHDQRQDQCAGSARRRAPWHAGPNYCDIAMLC